MSYHYAAKKALTSHHQVYELRVLRELNLEWVQQYLQFLSYWLALMMKQAAFSFGHPDSLMPLRGKKKEKKRKTHTRRDSKIRRKGARVKLDVQVKNIEQRNVTKYGRCMLLILM